MVRRSRATSSSSTNHPTSSLCWTTSETGPWWRVVRDAGATFLGPVQADLAGLVCLSGDLGSHLAIVSRELGTPALVGVQITEGHALREGTLVELDLQSGQLRALDA